MTDMITVSRKEIEALQKNFTKDGLSGNGDYINLSDLLALLDKAEVGEPSYWAYTVGDEQMVFKNRMNEAAKELLDDCNEMPLYTSPPNQSAKIAELEAEIARLKAIT